MYLINHIQRGFYPYHFASDRLLILFFVGNEIYITTNRQTKLDNKKVTAILTAISFINN